MTPQEKLKEIEDEGHDPNYSYTGWLIIRVKQLEKELQNSLVPFLCGEDSPGLRQYHVERINKALKTMPGEE